jgi:asparagine synthase (glutamine-hydrolysing)
MCGIFAIFNIRGDEKNARQFTNKLLKRLLHRGPDATGMSHFKINDKLHHFLCHQRLSIVDPYNGDQPLYGEDKNICCVANGEIYNHFEVFISLTFLAS